MNDVTSEAQGAQAADAATKAKPTKVEEVVSMADNSLVTFAGKKQIIKSSDVSEDGTITILFNFRNGQQRQIAIAPNDPIIFKLAAHGAEQKWGDEMAANPEKYSLEDRLEWFDELTDRVMDTSKTLDERWSAARESTGGVSGISILVRAIMELKGASAEDVKAGLNKQVETLGVTKQALVQALRNSPQLKPIVERLEAEKVSKASPVDVDSVLAGL